MNKERALELLKNQNCWCYIPNGIKKGELMEITTLKGTLYQEDNEWLIKTRRCGEPWFDIDVTLIRKIHIVEEVNWNE